MKSIFIAAILLALVASPVPAQNTGTAPTQTSATVPPPTPFQIVHNDLNSRVWQREVYTQTPDGQTITNQPSYVELCPGAYYTSQGQMLESRQEIDVLSDGSAAATQGQQQVHFPPDIYQGTILMTNVDGLTLQSQPSFLAYSDGENTVIIAVLTNSVGQLVGSNIVTYSESFSGIHADLKYVYKSSGLVQDVIFKSQPPSPQSLGLNPANTCLQMLTEFIDPPEPVQKTSTNQLDPNLTDATLSFGQMKFGPGRAFLVENDQNQTKPDPQLRVFKSWIHVQGRTFLVEAIPYPGLVEKLQNLPLSSRASTPNDTTLYALRGSSGGYQLPATRNLKAASNKARISRAAPALPKRSPRLVWDYETLTTDQTDFTFLSSTTYFIDGDYELDGTTTFQNGTILKFPEEDEANLFIPGTIVSPPLANNPAIFTSMNDDSCGESISGSSGSPATGGFTYLHIASANELDHCRFLYAGTIMEYDSSLVLNDIETFYCYWGLVPGGTTFMFNSLVSGCNISPYSFCDGNLTAENCTFDNSFAAADGDSTFTNCIFSNVGNPVYDFYSDGATAYGSNNGFYSTSAFGDNQIAFDGSYQSGPLGNYYLNSGSACINAGSASAALLGLYEFTTQTNEIPETNSTADLGYHYVALGTDGNPRETLTNNAPDYIVDANGDGLPDWWELEYFGNLNETATNQDALGNTLLYDYQNDRNPNVIYFTNFSNASSLQVNTNALITTNSDGCVLELTPSLTDQAGSAFSKIPILLSSNSFSTFFSFRLSKPGGSVDTSEDGLQGADGVVFLLQTLTNNVGGNGGGLGYSGITNSVAVEFDTWHNTTDPFLPDGHGDGNHIGIDVDGSVVSVITTNIPTPMNNGNIWYSWIDYNSSSSNLEVRLSGTNNRPASPTLAYTVNIISHLHTNSAYVGFTGATGGSWNQQDILAWEFITPYNPILTPGQITLAITSPSNQTLLARSAITITATNSSPNLSVKYLEFYVGTNNIGDAVSTNGIYQLLWYPDASGTDVLSVMAVNTNGTSTWSSPVTNYIRGLPSVSITNLLPGQIFRTSPTNILIEATATGDGSTISNVVFYAGTNVLGVTNAGSPFNCMWSNVTKGAYILTARATDHTGASGVSYPVAITVYPDNQPPSVYAGPSQTTNLPTTQLTGLISDDGLPSNTISIIWSKVSGPVGGSVIFGNSTQSVTSATFSTNGTYVLSLWASDGQLATSNSVIINVLPANSAPVVFPGVNQTIVSLDTAYPSSMQMQGVATDDGQPAGSIMVASWSEVSGPDPVTFANPNLTNTIATFDQVGTYVLRLTATDGQLTTSSNVTITVTSSELISYMSVWRYIFTNSGGAFANFAQTNYDDSAWSNGVAGFGTDNFNNGGGFCAFAFNNTNFVKTPWAGNLATGSDLLLRKHFLVPAGTTNLYLGMTVDNDAQIFINGVLLTTNSTGLMNQVFSDGILTNSSVFNQDPGNPNICYTGPGWYDHEGCASYDSLILQGISTNIWHTNDNVIAIYAHDCGQEAFVDARISFNSPLITLTNQAPAVFAGFNQYIPFGQNSTQLPGLVVDDGLPGTGNAIAMWTNVSGPGTVTFSSQAVTFANFTNWYTTATFPNAGTYVLNLIADDGILSATSSVTIVRDDGSYGPPSVAFVTPTNNASFDLGVAVPLVATASASTGAVANVQFFFTNNIMPYLIGTATNSPYKVSWLQPPAGNFTVLAVATDQAGRISTASINIQITTNAPPIAVDDPVNVAANSVNNILNPLANDSDSGANYPLNIIAITAPGAGTARIVNNGTAIAYTPEPGIRSYPNTPADEFQYTISDGHGGTVTANIPVVIDGDNLPVVTLSAASLSTNAGSADPIYATVSPWDSIAKVDFFVGQDNIGEVTNGSSGVYALNWIATRDPGASSGSGNGEQISASATDIYGQVGVATPIIIQVSPPANGGQAVAVLDSIQGSAGTVPLSGTNLNQIYDGRFQLNGRAYHNLGSNVTWQVGIYTIDGTLIRQISPVTSGTVGTSNTPATLMTCDLTTLLNGIYDLRLTVNGGYTTAETNMEIQLESNLKIGQFGFSQQDLVVPVNGIPLTVTRTYNSLNPNRGDFGYGWTYALGDLNASLDETRQDVLDTDGEDFSERSGGGWDVTLTLPNGQVTTFAFQLVPGVNGAYAAQWNAAPGVTARLGLLPGAQNTLETFVGSVVGDPSLFYWDAAGPSTPWEEYDFSGFVLTTLDGTQYYLTRDDLGDHFIDDGQEGTYVQAYGALHLTKVVERNGDSITINPGAITYQNATDSATRQVSFTRNDDNLITSVSDPNALLGGGSNNPAAIYQYDASDNLIAVLNLVGQSTGTYVTNSFSYTNVNFPHFITGIINANGTPVAENFYDDSGKLTAVQDANGNLTKFINNPTNNTDVIIDRLGFTNTYVYDLHGNVIAQTNQLGQITEMAYDANYNKTNKVTFLNGVPYATNSYVYDTNLNEILVSIDSLGQRTTNGYDSFGNVLTNIDANGNPTVNTYDGSGNLITTIDALGHGTTNFFTGGLLMGSLDAVGTVTTNYYDGSENLLATATLDASGNILSSNSYTYDDNANRLTSTVWRRVNGSWTGATTASVYDAMNRIIQTINPDGGINSVVYDPTGKQSSTVDPLGRTTSYIYDVQGRLVQTTYPDGTTNGSAYDANGNCTNRVDRDGNPTTYVYDSLNRVVETIYADQTTNATVYDGVGRTAQTIDALGNTTVYSYDAAGRRLAVTNALGTAVQMVTSYTYDANGNQLTMTDANNHTTTNVYDVLNRQAQVQYADGSAEETVYDADGRKVAATNQDGIVTIFGYDGAGKLTSVTNAVNKTEQMVTRYQYDEAGNETLQIDGLGRTNSFGFDTQGRRIWHQMPTNSLIEKFNYDLAGNQILATNFNGAVITNQYDANNRLTNCSSINGYVVGYTFSGTGQRLTMADPSGVTVYTYDDRERLIAKNEQLTNSGPTLVTDYFYDNNGNLRQISGANGSEFYNYDALNRLMSVIAPNEVDYSYDAAGNLQKMNYNFGVLTNEYQYDSLNRLTNLVWFTNGVPAAGFTYQLARAGTRTNLSENVNGISRTYAWSYDNLYRMTNELVNGTSQAAYQYDNVGNRLNRTSSLGGLSTTNYSYDANDRLRSDQYDANGSTTNSSGHSFQYDVMNHLVNEDNGRVLLWYDGDGNRVIKVVGGVTNYYAVDDRNPSGYAQVYEEYQDSGSGVNFTRFNGYGLGLVSAYIPLSGQIYYYGSDGHGSVRFITDSLGDITNTYAYDAYGTLLSQTGTFANNYLYSGQQWDPDMGSYYNRARYLNMDIGRFLTSDSFQGNNEDPNGLHKYLYAQDEPVDGSDPSGKAVYFVERKLATWFGPETWPIGVGHGYLYFTDASDPGTGDPFTTHQTAIDSFSWHPNVWHYQGSHPPGRLWEKAGADYHPPSQRLVFCATTDYGAELSLLCCINAYKDQTGCGYELGIEKQDPNVPSNQIGSDAHKPAPSGGVYYSKWSQNCVWWATIMLKQSNIQVNPAVYNGILNYDLGIGGANQVIKGWRSPYTYNTINKSFNIGSVGVEVGDYGL